jgi:hypothetical protein
MLHRKIAALSALSFVMLGAESTCGTPYVLHHFDLSSCPGDTFALPDTVEASGGRYKAEGSQPPCDGLRVYVSRNSALLVKLNRRPSCTLDVGYQYKVVLGESQADLRKYEEEQTPAVEAMAQLVMRGSNTAPRLPATTIEHFDSPSKFQSWCTRPK